MTAAGMPHSFPSPSASFVFSVGSFRWIAVAFVPVVWTSADQALRFFVGLALTPEQAAASTAVATIVTVAGLVAYAVRWQIQTRDVRRDAAAAQRSSEGRLKRISQVLEDADALRVVYQPVFELSCGQVSGYEALARFETGTPDQWFQDAHELGVGVELEILAVRRAIEGFGPGHGALGVNVSPATLSSPDLYGLLGEALPRFDVVLEITEHTVIENYDEVLTTLRSLRMIGAGVAVDDTGAGFASFRHVIALEPDTVKLDRSLVSGLGTDPARTSLARSLVDFATEMRIRLVAEGIETDDELAACRHLGIEAGQGYLLGRPAPLPSRPAGVLGSTQMRLDAFVGCQW